MFKIILAATLLLATTIPVTAKPAIEVARDKHLALQEELANTNSLAQERYETWQSLYSTCKEEGEEYLEACKAYPKWKVSFISAEEELTQIKKEMAEQLAIINKLMTPRQKAVRAFNIKLSEIDLEIEELRIKISNFKNKDRAAVSDCKNGNPIACIAKQENANNVEARNSLKRAEAKYSQLVVARNAYLIKNAAITGNNPHGEAYGQ